MATVNTAKELAAAIENGEKIIIVNNPQIYRPISKMKKLGKWSWGIFVGSITSAIGLVLAGKISLVVGGAATIPTGGGGAVAGAGGAAISFGSAAAVTTVPAAIVGLPTAIALISIAVASGGAGILLTLKNKYNIEEKSDGKAILKLK